jgi:PAS domain S-box-containing protein
VHTTPGQTTRCQNLLQTLSDALVGIDHKGLIRFVNRQTESLFGYDRDQLIGQRIDMLVPRSLWPICAEHQQGYLAEPRTRTPDMVRKSVRGQGRVLTS